MDNNPSLNNQSDLLQALCQHPGWELLEQRLRRQQDGLRKQRDTIVPGSPEDIDALCVIRGIDAVLKEPDTVRKLAAMKKITSR